MGVEVEVASVARAWHGLHLLGQEARGGVREVYRGGGGRMQACSVRGHVVMSERPSVPIVWGRGGDTGLLGQEARGGVREDACGVPSIQFVVRDEAQMQMVLKARVGVRVTVREARDEAQVWMVLDEQRVRVGW